MTVKLKKIVLGGLLLATSVASLALSIGRVRGAAWIGQPLDITVPVRLEAGEDGSSLCFDADVFHADNRIDPRNLRIVAESSPGSSSEVRETLVRVRSSMVVDEPVVTVYLKVGCDQKITRRLVLLAEIPTETTSAIAAAPLPVVPVPSLIAPAPAPGAPVAPVPRAAPAPVARAAAAASTETPARPPVPRAPRPARPPAPVVAAAPAAAPVAPQASAAQPTRPPVAAPKPAAAPVAPQSRLKLDPIEPPPQGDATLKSATQLASVSEENEQKRAEAAALWRSINAQPEDVLRDTQRLQGLEGSINALRSQMMQNQASISDLKTQLEQAQGERYANPLVYGLVALLLAALAAAGYFFQRSRRGGAARNADWWRDVDHRSPNTVQVMPAGGHPGIPPDEVAQATVKTRVAAPAAAVPAARKPSVDEIDVDLGFDDLPAIPTKPTVAFHGSLPRRSSPQTDFASSFGGSGRSVNTEELFDIHQQADFFLSLGQHEQAIGVLLGHIRDNPETSALAYLDLFTIYHQQNRREAYERLREEFHSAFNADVPEFDAFNESSRGLDAYQETLDRIVELWGSPDVITLVEELIFRRPDDNDGKTFDLEAYKELLLLFAVALEVSENDDDGFVISGPDSAYAEIAGAPLTIPPTLDSDPSAREATVSLPPLSLPPELADAPKTPVDIDLVLSDSMVAPLSSLPQPRPPAPAREAVDSGSIDFELFDPSTEAKLSPKKPKP